VYGEEVTLIIMSEQASVADERKYLMHHILVDIFVLLISQHFLRDHVDDLFCIKLCEEEKFTTSSIRASIKCAKM
jgi:hypothetical protein